MSHEIRLCVASTSCSTCRAGQKKRVQLRAGKSALGRDGWSIRDDHGAIIWCVTRACAEYLRELLRVGCFSDAETARRINHALSAELSPLTRFPPASAGDVIGQVEIAEQLEQLGRAA